MVLINSTFLFHDWYSTYQHVVCITVFLIECYENEFMCDNGFCILNRQFCDGKDNCGDQSDENVPECIAFRKL